MADAGVCGGRIGEGRECGFDLPPGCRQRLIGVNAFLDYEVNSDYDKAFWRGSLGAEYRSAIINVYLNRYFGITDGVRRDDGWVYTRNGIDAELDIQVPDFPLGGFSGGVTYYRWEGEYGDEDDKGFRYHLQLQPFGLGARLRFRLEFDSPDVGSAEWGGAVSYSYLFGAPSPSSAVAAASGFDPRAHFFDPARREYSSASSAAVAAVVVAIRLITDGLPAQRMYRLSALMPLR